jgi:hypothetical protein
MIRKSIEKKDVRIIPIILDDTPLPMLISDLFYIDYKKDIEENRTVIIKTITGRLPEVRFAKALVKKFNMLIYDSSVLVPREMENRGYSIL